MPTVKNRGNIKLRISDITIREDQFETIQLLSLMILFPRHNPSLDGALNADPKWQ